MLRGLPPEQTRDNLESMLKEFDKRGIKVVLLGMLAAPNYGKDYADTFNPIYPALARQYGAVLRGACAERHRKSKGDGGILCQDDRLTG